VSTHIPDASATAVIRTRSSFSGGNNNCVEVARLSRGVSAVRDSKVPSGPLLVVGASTWRAFLAGARTQAESFGA
jgi:hypothetical protein